MNINLRKEPILPLIFYGLLILIIIFIKQFLDHNYVISITAAYMLLVPLVLSEEAEGLFKFNIDGFKYAVVFTFIVLTLYLLALYAVLTVLDKQLSFKLIDISLIFIHLFLVAIPEETFFRGYLQTRFGNNYFSVVMVSILFSAAHIVTICLLGGVAVFSCSQSVLTFFPSLIMGFLYINTGTLWSSILFHFAANLIHLSIIIN